MTNWHKPAPAFLQELVSREPPLGPNPPSIIDWVEKDDKFVVILEDGRKLFYKKLDPGQRRNDFTSADFREHVGRTSERPASIGHSRSKGSGS